MPYKRSRAIKSTTSSVLPERCLFLAVQPKVRAIGPSVHEHLFRLAVGRCLWLSKGQVVDEEERIFVRPEEVFAWIRQRQQKDRKTWVFSYNLAYNLSLLGFWDRLGRSDEDYIFGVLEDPPVFLLTRRGRRLIQYVDITNYWRCPLDDLKGACGYLTLTAGQPSGHVADLLEEGKRKCRVIRTVVSGMISSLAKELPCSLKPTAAGCALQIYRTHFLEAPIIPHMRKEVYALEKSALFGGLLDCARTGFVCEPVNAVDVNSLYPFLMTSYPMPCELACYEEAPSNARLDELLLRYWVVAEVDLSATLAPLPQRRGARTICSDAPGLYSTSGTTLALHRAAGLVRSCSRVGAFHTSHLFSHFVGALYARKLEAAKAKDLPSLLLWKMLLNALPGKFSQKRRSWVEDPKAFCDDRYAYWWVKGDGDQPVRRYRSLAGRASWLDEGGPAKRSLAAINVAITTMGREHMQRLRSFAGEETVHYIDTDCLHVSTPGLERLYARSQIHPTELGKLKVLCSGPSAYYWSPKHYRVGSHFVDNTLHNSARVVANDVYLQEARQALPERIRLKVPDRIVVTEQLVVRDQGVGPISTSSGVSNS